MSVELIRILAAVRSTDFRDPLAEALPRSEGYELVWVDTLDEIPGGTGHPAGDVVFLELPYGDDGALDPIEDTLARASRRPVIVLAPETLERLALQAVQRGCTDYLLEPSLYPVLIRRLVHHAVERERAERRREQAERALTESEQRYRSLFEQSRDAIYMTERDGTIMELNQAALELLGYAEDDLLGHDVRSIYTEPADRERFQQEIEAHGHVRDFEVRLLRKDGVERWCLVSAWVRRNRAGGVEGYQGIIHDITARKTFEDQLAHEAFHDSLTGLPNRALFMDRLERAVARRRRGEERDLAVLFLDVDRFKVVNDSLGHSAGDELLRGMARLLAEEIREEDTVARIGGDEFAILLDGVDNPADPTHVAERIQEGLRSPMVVQRHDVFTSVSIGIALGGADVENPDALLRSADTAMYRAKELGPARYQIYDGAMHAHAVTLLQVETDLRLALERDQLVVHYQPVIDLDGDRIAGFEALVRWNHPEQGLLQPQAFIPVAEDTGLIVPLGTRVLRTAVRQLAAWRRTDPSFDSLFVSVNVSQRQFSAPDLPETVRAILAEEGLDGSALRLEITESALFRNPTAASQALQRLRALGVTLCIDDFGAGHSSLSSLHHLPIDILKIDRCFITRVDDDDEGRVVEALLALARNLGLEAIAEGVETEAQLSRLRSLGSAAAQGYLFSRPVDAEAALKLLEGQGTP